MVKPTSARSKRASSTLDVASFQEEHGLSEQALRQLSDVTTTTFVLDGHSLESIEGPLTIEEAAELIRRGRTVPPCYCRRPDGSVALVLVTDVEHVGFAEDYAAVTTARGIMVDLAPDALVRTVDGDVQPARDVTEGQRLQHLPRRRNKRRGNHAVFSVPPSVSGRRGHAVPVARWVAGLMRGAPLGPDEAAYKRNGDPTDDRASNVWVGPKGMRYTPKKTPKRGRSLQRERPAPADAPNVDVVKEVLEGLYGPLAVYRVTLDGADNVAIRVGSAQPLNSLLVGGHPVPCRIKDLLGEPAPDEHTDRRLLVPSYDVRRAPDRPPVLVGASGQRHAEEKGTAVTDAVPVEVGNVTPRPNETVEASVISESGGVARRQMHRLAADAREALVTMKARLRRILKG